MFSKNAELMKWCSKCETAKKKQTNNIQCNISGLGFDSILTNLNPLLNLLSLSFLNLRNSSVAFCSNEKMLQDMSTQHIIWNCHCLVRFGENKSEFGLKRTPGSCLRECHVVCKTTDFSQATSDDFRKSIPIKKDSKEIIWLIRAKKKHRWT